MLYIKTFVLSIFEWLFYTGFIVRLLKLLYNTCFTIACLTKKLIFHQRSNLHMEEIKVCSHFLF